LQDDLDDNDLEAEALLMRVLDGEIGTPLAPEFLAAARELGELRFAQGRYADAIEHLRSALDLTRGPLESAALRYRLADAYRLHAAQIRDSVSATTPDRRAEAIEDEARESLVKAMGLFQEVRDVLSSQESELAPPHGLYLRNAEFYLGDCAFDLEDYDRAIRFYEAARGKRPNDPASLVALIQIVNAYRAKGEYDAARTANERAYQHYWSFPEKTWNDPDLPMTNRDWERWLDASFQLTQQTGGED
jgi:tetratricopeptide (TPR) repeat protein